LYPILIYLFVLLELLMFVTDSFFFFSVSALQQPESSRLTSNNEVLF